MPERNNGKRKNDKLSLYPLKFEEAVKGFLKVKPEPKKQNDKSKNTILETKKSSTV